MDDVTLDDRFADLEAQAAATFRPAPLADVAARAHGRRVRHVTLAVVAAIAVLVPSALTFAAHRSDHPVPVVPNPAVSRSPSIRVQPVQRRVALAGVNLPLRGVWFTQDPAHAWALFESCPTQDYRTCRRALGRTSDGGSTWQQVPLPNLAADAAPLNLYPLDAQTLTINMVGKRFWLTTDGGATFTPYPASSPPAAARLAATFPTPGSPFTLLCPGATGFEDGASGIECDRQQLVRSGIGPVTPQPTLAGDLRQVISGSDGRIWLVSWDGNRTRTARSTDNAKTWQQAPAVPGHDQLTVSPDGQEVWLVGGVPGQLWQLSGLTLHAQTGLPDNAFTVAIGAGSLAVVTQSGTPGFWRNGTYLPLSGLDAVDVEVLTDGAVVFGQANGARLVGTGSGLDRTWVRLS